MRAAPALAGDEGEPRWSTRRTVRAPPTVWSLRIRGGLRRRGERRRDRSVYDRSVSVRSAGRWSRGAVSASA